MGHSSGAPLAVTTTSRLKEKLRKEFSIPNTWKEQQNAFVDENEVF